MITINTVSATKFSYDGITYHKNFMPFVTGNKIAIINVYDGCITLTDAPTIYSDYTVNGVTYGSVSALQAALLDVIYTRNSLSSLILTVTGNSGASTYNSTTGVLNVPNYTLAGLGGQPLLTNPITGTGTTNYLPKFTASGVLGNSLIYDNGTNVGIGTTSPTNKLTVTANDVFNQDSSGQIVIRGASNTNKALLIGFDTTSNYGYLQAIEQETSTRHLNLQPFGGNVGIGTTDPSEKLEVQGSIKSGNITANSGNKTLTFDNITNYGQSLVINSAGSLPMYLQTNGNNVITLNSSGNVGIGTTSPRSVSGFTTFALNNASNGGLIDFLNNGTLIGQMFNTSAIFDIGSVASVPLAFRTADSERMRIDQSGNVGIGTTSPSEKLHVGGNGLFSGIVTASAFFASSDERLKDITSKDGDVITYKWKDGRDDKLHFGYSAQHTEKLNPYLVNKDDKGFLSVNYTEVLVLKVRELEKQVAELKSKLN